MIGVYSTKKENINEFCNSLPLSIKMRSRKSISLNNIEKTGLIGTERKRERERERGGEERGSV